MCYLWNKIDTLHLTVGSKYGLYILLLSILSAAAGILIWGCLIRPFTLNAGIWGVCFAGYPMVISWLDVFFYSCSHEFHNSRTE